MLKIAGRRLASLPLRPVPTASVVLTTNPVHEDHVASRYDSVPGLWTETVFFFRHKDLDLKRVADIEVSEKFSLPSIRIGEDDPFLNELTNMYARNLENGSVWVTLKRSTMTSKAKRNKMQADGEVMEHRCLVRATDGKKTISTSLSAKEHLKFQASYATILKAHMSALKKRERKDKKKGTEGNKKVKI